MKTFEEDIMKHISPLTKAELEKTRAVFESRKSELVFGGKTYFILQLQDYPGVTRRYIARSLSLTGVELLGFEESEIKEPLEGIYCIDNTNMTHLQRGLTEKLNQHEGILEINSRLEDWMLKEKELRRKMSSLLDTLLREKRSATYNRVTLKELLDTHTRYFSLYLYNLVGGKLNEILRLAAPDISRFFPGDEFERACELLMLPGEGVTAHGTKHIGECRAAIDAAHGKCDLQLYEVLSCVPGNYHLLPRKRDRESILNQKSVEILKRYGSAEAIKHHLGLLKEQNQPSMIMHHRQDAQRAIMVTLIENNFPVETITLVSKLILFAGVASQYKEYCHLYREATFREISDFFEYFHLDPTASSLEDMAPPTDQPRWRGNYLKDEEPGTGISCMPLGDFDSYQRNLPDRTFWNYPDLTMTVSPTDQDYEESIMVRRVGTKAYWLKRAADLGIKVPRGYIVSMRGGADNSLLRETLARLLSRLDTLPSTGPALYSIRSTSKNVMPGMMNSFVNVGLPHEIRANIQNNPFYHGIVHAYLGNFTKNRDWDEKLTAHGEEIPPRSLLMNALSLLRKTGMDVPPHNRVDEAVFWARKVFDSAHNDNASLYRLIYGMGEDEYESFIIQKMVYGDYGGESLTGVFESFEHQKGGVLNGQYIEKREGPAIALGRVNTFPLNSQKNGKSLVYRFPECYKKLKELQLQISRYFGTNLRIEFTVENKELYLLQIQQVNPPSQKKQGSKKKGPFREYRHVASGIPIIKEVLEGVAVFGKEDSKKALSQGEVPILISDLAQPEDFHELLTANGYITRLGSTTSHIATLARMFNRATIVGTDLIRIDAINGYCITKRGKFRRGARLILDSHRGKVYCKAGDLTSRKKGGISYETHSP